MLKHRSSVFIRRKSSLGIIPGKGNDSLLSITRMSCWPVASWCQIQTPLGAREPLPALGPWDLSDLISAHTTSACPVAAFASHTPASGPLHLLFPEFGALYPHTWAWSPFTSSRSLLQRYDLRSCSLTILRIIIPTPFCPIILPFFPLLPNSTWYYLTLHLFIFIFCLPHYSASPRRAGLHLRWTPLYPWGLEQGQHTASTQYRVTVIKERLD